MNKPFENLKALVVDDYGNMRKKLSADLVKLGLKVTEASNGVEAIKILNKKKFDVMISDIVMPEMDGFELCQEVRTMDNLKNMPVVITSTHCDPISPENPTSHFQMLPFCHSSMLPHCHSRMFLSGIQR